MADLSVRSAEDPPHEQAGRKEARIIRGSTAESVYRLLKTIDTLFHDHAFSEIRAEAQVLLPQIEAQQTSEQLSEDLLVNRALDLAARLYPNRESEHCKALARAIYSAFVDLSLEVRQQTFAEQVLNPAQREKLERWCDEQRAKVLAEQQEKHPERKRPYFGATGGSLTWTRTPTSLGTVVTVVFCKGTTWEAELDLTDYSDW